MAILTIESHNENLSWVIFKNPQTQTESMSAFERPVRKGVVYGWYTDPMSFRLWFSQFNGEPSFYKNQDNNYLNADKALCAYAYCSIITNMLDATIKKVHEKDTICQNKVTLHTIWIPNVKMAQSFANHLKNIDIKLENLGSKLYCVSFSAITTLYELLNVAIVFSLMQSLEDRKVFIDLTESAVAKYAQCIKAINAPYYLIYMFLSRCVPDIKIFNQVVNLLQKDNWKLNFGNTQKQRYSVIKKVLTGGKVLHDIGCGELFYSSSLSHVYEKIYAWDSDEQIMKRNEKYIEKRAFSNIVLKQGFDCSKVKEIQPGADILITEMIEHISPEQAQALLKALANVEFSTLVITVPNANFNKYYLLEGKFRHPDHQWEPTYEQSIELIESCFPTHQIKIDKIGDKIDDDSVGTLFIIKKN